MSPKRSTPETRTLAASRQDEILARLGRDGSVSVEGMADRFGVSRETIRRDLKALAERGQLAIVHGGATRRSDEPVLAIRERDNPTGKAAIGRVAAGLVEDGMVVVLDSGATTLAVANALAGRDPLFARPAPKGLTVCTNSLPIGLLLCRVAGVRVHFLGGEIEGADEAAFGTDALAALMRFRADVAFVGAGGISPDGEITDFAPLPTELRVRMLAAAERGYVVADSTKFGRLTPLRLAPIPLGTGLIVDAEPPLPMRDALSQRGLTLIVAQ
ncbi:DeoR/GlpR family DNA-binding transcription regulator [Methylobacterium sp. Leaf112]|uniref:DeoR/GlpR family DNA-binding transcription regulator n=1 Tax=Methylobacterium sp. Leaf112 TaxID=1736258 RepID=UPI0006FFF5BF|nr:DeoR/GlpR family DNA-binding transcription regulator [Methylobacterium sp. Leaf112]KQP62180.1 GntR family transcriptional regulator [Methylobacterium sp. Leaf112]